MLGETLDVLIRVHDDSGELAQPEGPEKWSDRICTVAGSPPRSLAVIRVCHVQCTDTRPHL